MSKLKIITIVLLAIGLIFFLYGLMDAKSAAFMNSGSIFLAAGAIIYAMSFLENKLSTLANILSELDSTLTVPQVKTEPTMQPKTASYAAPFTATLASGAIVAGAIASKTEPKINETVPKRDYFNELSQYLEPVAEVKAVADVLEPKPLEVQEQPITIQPKAISRLETIAQDFPELDAILNKKEPPKLEPILEPILEPVVQAKAEPVKIPELKLEDILPQNEPKLIREGVINGVNFRLFSDGSIDADFSNGSHRFETLAEFRSYVDK